MLFGDNNLVYWYLLDWGDVYRWAFTLKIFTWGEWCLLHYNTMGTIQYKEHTDGKASMVVAGCCGLMLLASDHQQLTPKASAEPCMKWTHPVCIQLTEHNPQTGAKIWQSKHQHNGLILKYQFHEIIPQMQNRICRIYYAFIFNE